MSIYDDIPPERGYEGAWRGQIARGANDFTTPVEVIIYAFDRKQRFGPALWMPRDDSTFPERGDLCLVVFDEQRRPYVIAWWPS